MLDEALRAASPRLTPAPTPLRSVLIHGAIAAFWLLLIARAFALSGLLTWGAGIVYIAYDTLLIGFVFVQTLPLMRRPPIPPDDAPGTGPTLGVIVAAHNEAAVLSVTLAALTRQSDPPDLILIADDGSTDATPDVLARLYGLDVPSVGVLGAASSLCPALRWLRVPRAGKARALNAAMLLVDTDVVLTVDADTCLDADAVAAMRRAFADASDLVAATGVLTPVCEPTVLGRVFGWFQTYEYIRNFLSRYAWMRVDGLLLISGAFAGFRRQAVIEVGGFDPECLVEDYELIHRLRRHGVRHGLGWRTAVLGDARASTEAPGTIGGFLRQRRRWFGGFLQTQYWYREMVGNPLYGRLGTLMLPVKALDAFQPLFGLTALVLFGVFLATGRLTLAAAAGGVIGAKLVIDLALHLWFVVLYRRWAGKRPGVSLPAALLAALFEPFCFQILRHLGAALGWVVFLTGQRGWGRQERFGLGEAGGGVKAKAGAELRLRKS